MTLADVVSRFEAGVPVEGDFGHELASLVMEELAHCEESEQQAVLFADARNVSDELLAQYLRLDQEDKRKIAQVYAETECLKRLHPVPKCRKKKIEKLLGEENAGLLLRISGYSMLYPVIVNFVEFNNERNGDLVTLHAYLCSHNERGEKVQKLGTGSLRACCRYDFWNLSPLEHRDGIAVFESLTRGIGDRELVEKAGDYTYPHNLYIPPELTPDDMAKQISLDDFFDPRSVEVARDIIGMEIHSQNGIFVVAATKPYHGKSRQTSKKVRLDPGSMMMFNLRGHIHFCVATGRGIPEQDYFLVHGLSQSDGIELKGASNVSESLGLCTDHDGFRFGRYFRLYGGTKPSTFASGPREAGTCLGEYRLVKER